MNEQLEKETSAKSAEMTDSSYMKRKMLDDLAAQRAAITQKIKELEAEIACQ